MSYEAAEIVMGVWGISISKVGVYRGIQAVAEKVPGMKREKLLDGNRTESVGADLISVRCNGKWLPFGILVDESNGISLSIDQLIGEDAEQLKQWLEPILNTLDSDVLVSDVANAFNNVMEEIGLAQ